MHVLVVQSTYECISVCEIYVRFLCYSLFVGPFCDDTNVWRSSSVFVVVGKSKFLTISFGIAAFVGFASLDICFISL